MFCSASFISLKCVGSGMLNGPISGYCNWVINLLFSVVLINENVICVDVHFYNGFKGFGAGGIRTLDFFLAVLDANH